ncbi:MAG: cAMP-binding proteins - catabolite gene activator and regulatory subunit of cAMP-dependent protein kinases, partial [uncultured Cytophagales bacterium]
AAPTHRRPAPATHRKDHAPHRGGVCVRPLPFHHQKAPQAPVPRAGRRRRAQRFLRAAGLPESLPRRPGGQRTHPPVCPARLVDHRLPGLLQRRPGNHQRGLHRSERTALPVAAKPGEALRAAAQDGTFLPGQNQRRLRSPATKSPVHAQQQRQGTVRTTAGCTPRASPKSPQNADRRVPGRIAGDAEPAEHPRPV